MTSRVVFTDPDTGLVIDSFEFESLTGDETLTAHEAVVRVLGIVGDPAALLDRIESDAAFRAKLLTLECEPIFQGMHGGKLDVIAGGMISRAQSMCRAVEARIAAEVALQECSQ